MKTEFLPNWESVRSHTRPRWFDDAKLGIFVHWGLYSVPAWAEKKWELGGESSDYEWFVHNSYAEWYMNTIGLKESEAWAHHKRTYGGDFPYARFAESFMCERFDPAAWAGLFKEAGAGYVILTTKHHDGFCLYPSAYTDYNSVMTGPNRDLTGELTQAVRDAGLRMGFYYSGLLDWTFDCVPITEHHLFKQDYNLSQELADYSRNQVMELIDMYKPSVFWNDIGWPEKGIEDLPGIFAHYYNNVPEGIVNDRFSGHFGEFRTPEYLMGDRSAEFKWEMCRGLGLSFGYNQNESAGDILSGRALVEMLCEYVSENGNLLINVGPKADGTIPDEQAAVLRELGAWLREHGEAIYATRPCEGCRSETLTGGAKAFYTQGESAIYAVICGLEPGSHTLHLPALDIIAMLTVTDEMPVHISVES